MQQPRRSPLCAFSTHLDFDTLLREMWSGINVGADSRWIWAVRILVLGFAALATAHLIGGIIHRNVIGPLFWASATGVALSLLAYGAILELLSTDKHMKLGLALAASWGVAKFLSTVPYILPQLYGVRIYSVVGGPGARYLKPIAMLSLALTVTAIMAYRTMERRSGEWRVLLWGIAIEVLYTAGVQVLVRTMTSHFLLHYTPKPFRCFSSQVLVNRVRGQVGLGAGELCRFRDKPGTMHQEERS